ncbi:N-acetylmuramoyl-L-alanine amidase family protein [Brumimicrobium mesophilum]|uniref:N-acetylmuramoyl-L-alanine amidase family protein n=1 Tax=Brumimicrobium mesophilum TaxID=392717 RepID=UPI000D141450|nr:N-acetylmuramoyl-L-alanine amidase [Brumimicrobium mesophilum]
MGKHRIILDPGHGGVNPSTGQYVTPGKRSFHPVDGAVYYEGEIMRAYACTWANILRNAGYEVVFTVEPTDYTDVSLNERIRKVNTFHAQKKSILVPIHSNGVRNPTAHGHEVFTSPGVTNSDQLATFWIEEFEAMFPNIHVRKDFSDGYPDKEANFMMLTLSNCVAIYLELLFHTNDAEVRILRSQEFKEKTGQALLRAIIKYEQWLN